MSDLAGVVNFAQIPPLNAATRQSHDETGCQMTGDKFRARADGYIKASRPDPNKVSPLNSLAWSDTSSGMRCKLVADIGGRAWLAAMPTGMVSGT